MRQKFIYGIIALILIFSLLGVAFFAYQGRSDVPLEKKVAVTIFGIHDVVARVAGDKVKVVQILPPGQSPHTFDPSPSLLSEISGARATFKVGLGVDDWIDPIAKNANTAMPLIELSPGVSLICNASNNITPPDSGEGTLPASLISIAHAEEPACNPHIWLSVKNMEIITDTVTNELSSLFPEDRLSFQQNASTYKKELLSLDSEIAKMFEGKTEKSFLTFHDAFSYFARDYNLKIAATIEPFPGKEPTAAYLNEVTKTIQNLGIRTIFREPELSDAVVKSLAQDLDLRIGTLDSAEATTGNTTYVDVMRKNAQVIADTLK